MSTPDCVPAADAVRVLLPLHLDETLTPVLGARVHGVEGASMGTSWRVLWVADGQSEAGPRQAQEAAVRAAVQAELDLVIAQMSHWRPDSDLGRFNRAAPGTVVSLPQAFAEVLSAGLSLAELSGGAFNPAAGALVNLWGFGPSSDVLYPPGVHKRYDEVGFHMPTQTEVGAALVRCDWRALRFDGRDRIVQPGGVQLDFSAIAKGYAVDRIVSRLRSTGLAHLLVEVGGELRGVGYGLGGQPWWVELESPGPASLAMLPRTRVALHGLSVATSGDYRRCYTRDGQRMPHTIDPRTGRPIAHGLASVSVLHEECLWADAWSTALTVLGLESGLALAREHGIAALFVQREPAEGGAGEALREVLTPALQALASASDDDVAS
ncbi:FAD:protein FMN transferase [Hylemonella sp. W303a]|uniref:FAD:protein FMN transferase n=1 Tax=Hylemonella sp. W303a TaxID=3389873 RepID=UPI00396B0B06